MSWAVGMGNTATHCHIHKTIDEYLNIQTYIHVYTYKYVNSWMTSVFVNIINTLYYIILSSAVNKNKNKSTNKAIIRGKCSDKALWSTHGNHACSGNSRAMNEDNAVALASIVYSYLYQWQQKSAQVKRHLGRGWGVKNGILFRGNPWKSFYLKSSHASKCYL